MFVGDNIGAPKHVSIQTQSVNNQKASNASWVWWNGEGGLQVKRRPQPAKSLLLFQNALTKRQAMQVVCGVMGRWVVGKMSTPVGPLSR